MARSRKTPENNSTNDVFCYPNDTLFSTYQHMQFWADRTNESQDQDDICSRFTAKFDQSK